MTAEVIIVSFQVNLRFFVAPVCYHSSSSVPDRSIWQSRVGTHCNLVLSSPVLCPSVDFILLLLAIRALDTRNKFPRNLP